MITSKTLSTVCFLTAPGPGCSKLGSDNPDLNSDVKASFCQQVDDWTLLKITEKIIQRNVFKKRKRYPG